MNIFKPGPMNNQQRFQRALLFGIPIAIVIGVIHYFAEAMLPITFSIIYVIVGYAVGQALQYVSHGIGKEFKYLAVAVYILSIIVSDVFMPSFMYNFSVIPYFMSYVRSLFSINGVFSIASRVFGGVAAYYSM